MSLNSRTVNNPCYQWGTHGFFSGQTRLEARRSSLPYLFILSIEYLSCLLKKNTAEGFNYHPKCEAIKLPQLAFADDLMLFSRADEGSVKTLMDPMKEFGRTSKLELNILKSNIYLAGVSDFEAYGILDLSWLTRGDYSFRYLGVPIIDEAIREFTSHLFLTG